MGREIRRVPPNWEHPKYTEDDQRALGYARNVVGTYRPVFDTPYSEAKREWLDGLAKWERGEHEDQADGCAEGMDYWEYHSGPPERAYYLPDWPEGSATWWQLYETVSEGTPLSPPFATAVELVDWLATHKDWWGYGPRPREQAERFVKAGWVPSMVVTGGAIYANDDALAVLPREREP